MAIEPITAALELGGKLIDRFFPDKEKADAAKLELFRLQQSGELAQINGQLEINKIEASSASLFVSGWRPYVGWVAGTALAMAYIPKALVLTVIWTYQAYVLVAAWHGVGALPLLPAYPDLGVTDLLGLLGTLLGFGGLRALEKINGVAAK